MNMMNMMDSDGRYFVDVPREQVVVACMPNGDFNRSRIWIRRFIGLKVCDNDDGTIRVQLAGPASDFTQAVFHKGVRYARHTLALPD